jgi:hypothetical protein
MTTTVFAYYKNGDYKCLELTDSLKNHDRLIENGWKHTATINAAIWLERYLNAGESEKLKMIEGVSKT